MVLTECHLRYQKVTITFAIKPKDCLSSIINFQAIIISSICKRLPSSDISYTNFEYTDKLKLADLNFNKAHEIHILIGGEMFPSILGEGRIVRPLGQQSALKTIFGWVPMIVLLLHSLV